MNAWLLTWEGTQNPAISDDYKIAAILSGRLGSASVEFVVDALYTRCIWTATDLVHFAHRPRAREKQFRHTYSQLSRFFYGANPCIFARLVTDLVVQRDEERHVERVTWTELPYCRIEEPGGMPVEVEPATTKELTRVLDPIVAEIYRREA